MKAAIVGLAAGCLGPQVSDELPLDDRILAPDATVASVEADPVLRAQLAANDGVSARIPLTAAFAAGAPIRGWDFGPAPEFAAPIFVLVRAANGGLVTVDHPTIVDAMPGDPGYSPFWAVFTVEVTDRYAGERLTSFEAVAAARRAGLVGAPVAETFAVNCPAVSSEVELDLGGAAVRPTSLFYYRGRSVPYYDFGRMPLTMGVFVPTQDRHVLRRDGEEWLSEPRRGVDIDGDGDVVDTNDIESQPAAAPDRTPACRIVEVTVARGIASIDTSGDQDVAALTAGPQLFAPEPRPGVVVAFRRTDELRNCPIQHVPGAPR